MVLPCVHMNRTSISLDDKTLRIGLANAARRGFQNSFSAYIAWLIMRDAVGDVIREDLMGDMPKRGRPPSPPTKPEIRRPSKMSEPIALPHKKKPYTGKDTEI